MPISKIEDAIKDFKKGKMVILVDDADRENEGDLIVASEFATPNVINFMATHGRGLICVTMDTEVADRLDLSPVKNSPKENLDTTAFTISIDANKGTTTGISAQDRSTTAKLVILTSPYLKLAINLFYRINNLRVKPIVTFFYFYFYRH